MEETIFDWLAGDTPGVSAETLQKTFLGWRVVYLIDKGQRTGGALLNGNEIHFTVAPKWRRRAIRRDNARTFLAPLLEEHTFLTTRVLVGAAGPADFVRRMGFTKTWSDSVYDYFILCELPFNKA